MPIFEAKWAETMESTIAEIEEALGKLGKPSPWSTDLKVSDEFLPIVFQTFYAKLDLPNLMQKSNYHQLARFVPLAELDREIEEVLDLIHAIAGSAKPKRDIR